MRHILIIISIFLLISPLFGQSSSKYKSVNQCVLQKMKERNLTGNEIFEVVKEVCGSILGKVEGKGKKKQKGVLFRRVVNGKWGYFKAGDEKKDFKYVGEIVNGKPNGSGTYTSPGGFKYVGEFKNGKHHGKGTLYHRTGAKYEGEWKDNLKHGQGSHTFSNGLKIVGEFRRNRPWKATWFDKKGHFIKNTVNSIEKIQKGILFGRKVNGKLEWYKTGDEFKDEKYVGEIENGKPNGYGTGISTHGSKYVGGWKDGELHGQGRVTWSYENVLFQTYVGEWKDGKMWFVTGYDKDGNINRKWVNGKRQK